MSNLSRGGPRNPYVPQEFYEGLDGVRPSVAKILELVDVNDPSFGRVAAILSDMVKAGVDLDESAVTIALKMGKLPNADSASGKPEAGVPANIGLPIWGGGSGRQSIVYYIRRGPLIKIGTTVDPQSRFRDLVPDEILAFEPGDRRIEELRHQQFADLRKGNREYFEPGAILMTHIKRIRVAHGDPDPKWATTQAVAKRNPTLSRILCRPDSPEVASAAAIARALGIKANTVRAWASRGQLQPVAGSRPNRPLYFVDQARRLAEQSKAWSASR